MRNDRPPPDPYTFSLAALGRRELTERQLRTRLTRRGCAADAIDTAMARLRQERLLDDERAAHAFARTEARVKRRGPLRIQRTLETMGVDRETARSATAAGFDEQSVEAALEAALTRRLRGPIVDSAQARRLVSYLVRQGFDLQEAAAAVRRRRATEADDD